MCCAQQCGDFHPEQGDGKFHTRSLAIFNHCSILTRVWYKPLHLFIFVVTILILFIFAFIHRHDRLLDWIQLFRLVL